ncbi:putative zinc finger protein [Orchesella cincta]|uniref:Putative zinc finger protein n=1 Tax=Orchesella cincta TaxID=48709 RepID=A0A1D2M3K3_ORCCI|nr:putative zinc finger protein [Orchesella cincta]
MNSSTRTRPCWVEVTKLTKSEITKWTRSTYNLPVPAGESVRPKKKKHVSTKREYKCAVCGKVFDNRSVLSRHYNVHTRERPYQCPVCSKPSARTETVTAHLKVHTGEKPFSCTDCDASFARATSRKIHMKWKHSIGNGVKCTVCSKEYPTKPILKIHMKTHSTKKPFSCLFCETLKLK